MDLNLTYCLTVGPNVTKLLILTKMKKIMIFIINKKSFRNFKTFYSMTN